MEEEIDLRQYIEVILKHWKWIIGLTLAAVITVAIVSFFLIAPVYEAKVGVVIVKSKSAIVFEPKYRTLTEEELARAGGDIVSRRRTLEALVKSSPVATEVIAQLGEPEVWDVDALLGMVRTETDGDLIVIKVRGKDAGEITAIANAWGEAYERYVNELYGEKPQPLENIQAQVVEARKGYQKAQEALAQFLGDNQIDTLIREIEARQNTLADYYATQQGLDRLIADAKTLREQLQEGTSSSPMANGLSIFLLRVNAFMASTNLPLQPSASLSLQPSTSLPLQFQLPLDQMTALESSVEEQVRDLDTLIAVLEARRKEVRSLISEGTLQEEVLELQEQLERKQAEKRGLTQDRDLTWETYQTLARKEAEVGIASQVTDTEVRFAVPAVEPKYPVAPRKKLNIAVAGVLGLMVGVFGAFVMEYFKAGREIPE